VGYLEAPRVSRHERSGEANGEADGVIVTFARGEVGLVSLPAANASLDDDAIEELIDVTRLDEALGRTLAVRGLTLAIDEDSVTLTVADRRTLRPTPSACAAIVHDPAPAVLDDLRGEVAPLEWRDGGGDTAGTLRVGALAGGVLVALATAERPMGRLARLRVVVSPAFRQRGYGRLVLHALARRVLNEGFLPFGRLAVGNLAAHALAAGVGFVDFARSLTMRVVAHRDQPTVTSINP
jgi:GNAT superfamily N-acetyltransferase